MRLKQVNAYCVHLRCYDCGEVHHDRHGRHFNLLALQHVKEHHCDGMDEMQIYNKAPELVAELMYIQRCVAFEVKPQVYKGLAADISEGEE